MFSEVCARRAAPLRYSPARYSGALMLQQQHIRRISFYCCKHCGLGHAVMLLLARGLVLLDKAGVREGAPLK